jgi:hypothetical protein
MRLYYLIFIAIFVTAFGITMFPTLHLFAGTVSTTGWLPLWATLPVIAPYAFLAFIGYIIWNTARK